MHGSAPDIAGKGAANPIATIASLAMCLRYSFFLGDTADRIDRAIAKVLDQGLRTADIEQDGCRTVGTTRDGRGHRRGARPLTVRLKHAMDALSRGDLRGASRLMPRFSPLSDAATNAAEPSEAAPAAPDAQPSAVLTPEELAEKEARKACKKKICDIIATRDPNGEDVACDIIKTWREEDIVKMLGGKIGWPWGKAVCQSRLELQAQASRLGDERSRV